MNDALVLPASVTPPAALDILRSRLLRGQDPYAAADDAYLDDSYPHTNLPIGYFRQLSDLAAPGYVVELGSMYGGSAVRMCRAADRPLVCVDPFTGDAGMWLGEHDTPKRTMLGFVHGRPTVYERFLANVRHAGFAPRVLPMVCTSTVGLRVLQRLVDEDDVPPPAMIYLDSAHEPDETLIEVESAWSLLASGGVLFGDDWSIKAVRADVLHFAAATLEYSIRDRERELLIPDDTSGAGLCWPRVLYGQHWAMVKA